MIWAMRKPLVIKLHKIGELNVWACYILLLACFSFGSWRLRDILVGFCMQKPEKPHDWGTQPGLPSGSRSSTETQPGGDVNRAPSTQVISPMRFTSEPNRHELQASGTKGVIVMGWGWMSVDKCPWWNELLLLQTAVCLCHHNWFRRCSSSFIHSRSSGIRGPAAGHQKANRALGWACRATAAVQQRFLHVLT